MGEYLLETQGISKSFSTVKVLEDINLKIRKGEIHALLGENGAGKSTLMKILTGVLEADKGTILYRGKPLKIVHPREIHEYGIGIVYQEFNLLPDLTVAENIFIGREPQMSLKGFINDSKLNKEAAQLLERLNCSSISIFLPLINGISVKAGVGTQVTGGSVLFYPHQQGIFVAVGPQLHNVLIVAAGLPLEPQLLPGPGPEAGELLFQGNLQGLPIHIGQGKHLPRVRVLDNGGDQSPLVKF